MRNSHLLLQCTGLAFACCGMVQADVRIPDGTVSQPTRSDPPCGPEFRDVSSTGSSDAFLDTAWDSPDYRVLPTDAPAEAAGHLRSWSGNRAGSPPPLPSSAAMFLSAVLGLGAWRGVRSARQLQFDAVPEWYHTGGPVQVGFSVPFDVMGSPVLNVVHEPISEPLRVSERAESSIVWPRVLAGLKPRISRGPPIRSS